MILKQIAPYGVSLGLVVAEWCASRRQEKNERLFPVVVTYLQHFDVCFRDAVNQAVCCINTPGPESGKIFPQRFRFAFSFKRSALYFFDHFHNALAGFAVIAKEELKIFPCLGRKDDVSFHGTKGIQQE